MYEADLKSIKSYLDSLNQAGGEPLPHETDTQWLLWLQARLEDGILLSAGAIEQQPQWYIDDMQYLSTLDYYYDLPYLISKCDEQLTAIAKKTREQLPKNNPIR